MIARDYFDHDSPDGGTSSERAAAAGYHSPTGENIAGGDESASEVVQTWMDSPGHRANILDCDYHSTGVGLARGGKYGTYWTQMFGYA
jgi:uncharacterized protein YkwD